MTKFIMESTKLPTFDPLPKYIWNMDLSDTDKLIYVALLGRTTLSQKNKWIDKEGHIFIVFEVAKLARYVGKSESTVFKSLRSLENNDLIKRVRNGFDRVNHIYVKLVEAMNNETCTCENVDITPTINNRFNKSETTYDTYKKSHTNNKNNNNKNINNLYSFEDEFNYTKGDGF